VQQQPDEINRADLPLFGKAAWSQTAGKASVMHIGETAATTLAPTVPATGYRPRAQQFTAISSRADTTSEI
jgi:hypothetical protein